METATFSSDVILPVSIQQKQVQKNFEDLGRFVAESDVMKNLLTTIEKVAPTFTPVLLIGEFGVGKGSLARLIHEKSFLAGPFFSVSCSLNREGKLEQELFGYDAGAFTGATQTRKGIFEAAHGGTVFIEEIHEMSLELQTKILRYLQSGEIVRIGGKEAIRSQVRLVVSSCKNLEGLVARGLFREDLFYRINTITLEVAPIRRRRADILPLIQYFMEKNKTILGRLPVSLSAEAEKVVLNYDWPGNLREIANFCERLQIMHEGTVDVHELPDSMTLKNDQDVTRNYDPYVKLSDLERHWILKAMEYYRGNKTQAAQSLGITIKTLYNKLHEYGVFNRYAIHNKMEGDI
ncbi:MAG: sigma-54 dependent transcriptional regulator [Bdellovibrionaceae bacterium]|nr:sigma-54 dependent transcriptional regulator [Pseudobdellovibrionaceae bacterium]MDW8191203.1 sigma-54 dependent transcriptional regulator [Pseudobdellovibrionaceae bacterium]